ncbi:Uncharacterized protein Fot_38906 [Forsythia ovata]|uniref:Uncharacterized protein n=1 Tax=Forsythia ovata TaxID=205694 RepID=A0ABD1S4Q5_9LAMI
MVEKTHESKKIIPPYMKALSGSMGPLWFVQGNGGVMEACRLQSIDIIDPSLAGPLWFVQGNYPLRCASFIGRINSVCHTFDFEVYALDGVQCDLAVGVQGRTNGLSQPPWEVAFRIRAGVLEALVIVTPFEVFDGMEVMAVLG